MPPDSQGHSLFIVAASTLRLGRSDPWLLIGQLLPSDAGRDANVDKLHDERLVVLAGKRNRWTRRSSIALAELVDEPWILAPLDASTGSRAADAFRASGLSLPHATVFSFSHSLRISLLATGRFLTMLPASMFLFGGKQLPLNVLPVKLPPLSWPVGIVTAKNRTMSPVAQLFIKCCHEIAGGIGERLERLADAARATPRAR